MHRNINKKSTDHPTVLRNYSFYRVNKFGLSSYAVEKTDVSSILLMLMAYELLQMCEFPQLSKNTSNEMMSQSL